MKLANCWVPGCQAVVPEPATTCVWHRGEDALKKLEDALAAGESTATISQALRRVDDFGVPVDRIKAAVAAGQRRWRAELTRRREKAAAEEPDRPGEW